MALQSKRNDSSTSHFNDSGSNALPGKCGAACIAHATIATAAVYILAISAIALRLWRVRNIALVHAGVQVFAFALLAPGVGLGIWLACQQNGQWWHSSPGHEYAGIATLALGVVPFCLGYMNHRHWARSHTPTWRTSAHVWSSRGLILLGMLAGVLPNVNVNPTYGTFCVLILLVWVFAVWWSKRRLRREVKQGVQATAAAAPRAERGSTGDTQQLAEAAEMQQRRGVAAGQRRDGLAEAQQHKAHEPGDKATDSMQDTPPPYERDPGMNSQRVVGPGEKVSTMNDEFMIP